MPWLQNRTVRLDNMWSFSRPWGQDFRKWTILQSVALGPVWNHCTVYCFNVLNLLKENGTSKGEAASVLIINFKIPLWGEFTGMAKAVTNLFQLTV